MYKTSYLLLLGVLVGFNFMKMNLAFAKPAPQTYVLQRISIPQSPYQMGMGITEFAPNASKAAQKQTGPELCYVLEGEITFMVEGQAPRKFKVGDSYQNLPNLVHWTKAGPNGAKILATWALQPGKPFKVLVH
ncbi:cupin domain-containing protein [Rickettsiella endosymbiont of Rhagonycha lignosa]|uniref:cupin domain-containing protein n=1 Tax=Rickettsiella endosymbiont of Rhagonycha lignosa TaxID=3077937 RepID=UPI00313E17E0